MEILRQDNFLTRSTLLNVVYLIFVCIRHKFVFHNRFVGVSDLYSLKNSDTLAILGAGETVLQLTKKQKSCLKKFDVVGFGYTCILPYKQMVLFYESASDHELNLMDEHVYNVYPLVIDSFKNGKIKSLVWKNSENRTFEKRVDTSDFLKVSVFTLPTGNSQTFFRVFQIYKFFKLDRYFLLQARSSLVGIISFGLLLGYKNIVFSGVDLNNSDYFFNTVEPYKSLGLGDPYVVLDGVKSPVHRTNDPQYGIPLAGFLKGIFSINKNVNFMVSSERSVLSDFIDIWK